MKEDVKSVIHSFENKNVQMLKMRFPFDSGLFLGKFEKKNETFATKLISCFNFSKGSIKIATHSEKPCYIAFKSSSLVPNSKIETVFSSNDSDPISIRLQLRENRFKYGFNLKFSPNYWKNTQNMCLDINFSYQTPNQLLHIYSIGNLSKVSAKIVISDMFFVSGTYLVSSCRIDSLELVLNKEFRSLYNKIFAHLSDRMLGWSALYQINPNLKLGLLMYTHSIFHSPCYSCSFLSDFVINKDAKTRVVLTKFKEVSCFFDLQVNKSFNISLSSTIKKSLKNRFSFGCILDFSKQ